MEALVDKAKEAYVDYFGATLAPSKIVVFLIFVLAIASISSPTTKGLWPHFLESKVVDLFSTSDGLLAVVTVKQLLYATILTYISSSTFIWLKTKIFSALSSTRDFPGYIERLVKEAQTKRSKSEGVNWYLAKQLENDIDQAKSHLRRIGFVSETLLALVIATTFGLPSLRGLDVGAMFLFVGLFGYSQWRAFSYYVSKVTPLLITERALTGENIEFGEGLD